MTRGLCVVLLLAAAAAQRQVIQVGSATQVMSPTVVASWYMQQQPDGSQQLQLVVLWRGTIAWWREPGGISSGSGGDGVIQYGRVRLTLGFDAERSVARINGREIALRGDNVLYVDDVDGPNGARPLRTGRINPRMPGTAGQVGVVLAQSQRIVDYLQCRARTGTPNIDVMLVRMCVTNLGRE